MKTAITEFDKLRQVNLDAGLIFSGQKSGTIVKGYEKPTAFTPKINPNYVFHESVRDLVVWFIATPTPIYVCGASGAGKSSAICQLAARLNYPVFEVTEHNRLEFQDLIGHHIVQNGNMKFEYGPPVAYALDRALGFRACKETRAMLHELVQRIFPVTGESLGEI